MSESPKTESPREMAREARVGRSDRTPALALTGVTMAVAVLVAVILLAAFLVYYLA
jgi:hypothetical protein